MFLLFFQKGIILFAFENILYQKSTLAKKSKSGENILQILKFGEKFVFLKEANFSTHDFSDTIS